MFAKGLCVCVRPASSLNKKGSQFGKRLRLLMAWRAARARCASGHRQLGDQQAWSGEALALLCRLTLCPCLSIEKHQMPVILGRFDLFDR